MPSPDGRYVLCYLLMKYSRGSGPSGPSHQLLDGTGKILRTFKSRGCLWSAEGSVLFFNHEDEIRRLDVRSGQERTLFRVSEYLKDHPQDVGPDWTWNPRPVSVLKDGRMVAEISGRAPFDPSLMRRPGGEGGPRREPGPGGERRPGPARETVRSKRKVVVWAREGGRSVFRELGAAGRADVGEVQYVPLGRSGLLLRHEYSSAGSGTMGIVDPSTGETREIKLPRTLSYQGQTSPLHYRLFAVNPEGDTVVFSAQGRVNKTVRRGRSTETRLSPHCFGFFVLDVRTGKFKHVQPFSDLLERCGTLASSGRLFATNGRMDLGRPGSYAEGVWICDPDGRGVVLAPRGR